MYKNTKASRGHFVADAHYHRGSDSSSEGASDHMAPGSDFQSPFPNTVPLGVLSRVQRSQQARNLATAVWNNVTSPAKIRHRGLVTSAMDEGVSLFPKNQ